MSLNEPSNLHTSVASDSASKSSRHMRRAVVTGASQGIGKAIALALAAAGVDTCIIARSQERLESIALEANENHPSHMQALVCDLTVDEDIKRVPQDTFFDQPTDILVHCAGTLRYGAVQDAPIEDLDLQYQTNFRGPYLLTKLLLPELLATKGQVVFVNSGSVTNPKAQVAQYTAFQHALRGFADCLREEMNPQGVRVVSLFVGRTATPMQEQLFEKEGRNYQPELLMQPEDVAQTVLDTLTMPRTAEVTDIQIRPMVPSY